MEPVKMRIRKNDQVVVIAGRDKGKRGRVLQVMPERNRVVVEGANMVKRHTRANPQRNVKGGIVEREGTIHASNVMLICPETNQPSRVGAKILGDGRKVRVARKSGAVVDNK